MAIGLLLVFSVCYVCMYVWLLPKESDGVGGWACSAFSLQVLLLALEVHWAMWFLWFFQRGMFGFIQNNHEMVSRERQKFCENPVHLRAHELDWEGTGGGGDSWSWPVLSLPSLPPPASWAPCRQTFGNRPYTWGLSLEVTWMGQKHWKQCSQSTL